EWPGRGAQGRKSRHGDGARSGRHGEGHGRHGGGHHHGEGPGHHGEGHGRHGRYGEAAWAEEFGRFGEALARLAMARGKGRHGRPTPEELEDLIALRRMRGGPFGGSGPFGPGPRRRRGRGRARRGDVRLAILRLLAEEPANGYQLMQTIEERSGGTWRPSPGSVYPTLAQLEDEGLVRSTEGDGGRHFEITDAGREHLQTRVDEPAPWKPADEETETALYEIGPLVIGIGKAAWQVASAGNEEQRARASQLLAETRRALYGILAEDPGEAADFDDEAGDEPTEPEQPESSSSDE
ncbi:MAG: PadR family transcriptional regulator, partial [Solirubrobacteraceae bacterium]